MVSTSSGRFEKKIVAGARREARTRGGAPTPQVMMGADWLVELGPDGGDAGGRIVVAGAPREVAKKKTATEVVLAGMGG